MTFIVSLKLDLINKENKEIKVNKNILNISSIMLRKAIAQAKKGFLCVCVFIRGHDQNQINKLN